MHNMSSTSTIQETTNIMVVRQRVLLQSRTPRQMNKKHLSKFPPIIKIKLHLILELNHYHQYFIYSESLFFLFQNWFKLKTY